MRRFFVILIVVLILTGLLSYPSLSLAQRIPEGGKWEKKAPMPTARAQLSAAAVNNLIYAIGGFDGAQMLGTVEQYNPSTDTWKKAADMPTIRRLHATAAVGGIYACRVAVCR